jgi:hypothetical protein
LVSPAGIKVLNDWICLISVIVIGKCVVQYKGKERLIKELKFLR